MADKKISALTASATPLAGTEVLPIVQSGATVKVSIADVTAGRAVSASSLTASTGNFVVSTSGKGLTTGSAIPLGLGVNNTLTAMTIDTAGKVGIGNSSPSYTLDVLEGGAGGATVNPIRVFCAAGGASTARIMFGSASNTENAAIGAQTTAGDTGDLTFDTDTAGSLTEKMRISSVGNITASVGNIVIGTAGKGIVDSTSAVALNFSSTAATLNSPLAQTGAINTITNDFTGHINGAFALNDTATISNLANGFIEIAENAFGACALIMVGTGATTIIAQSTFLLFSTIAGNPGTVNIYKSGANVIIENKNAATLTIVTSIRKLG